MCKLHPSLTYTRGTDLSGSQQGAGGIGGLLARSTSAYTDATDENALIVSGAGPSFVNGLYTLNPANGRYEKDPYTYIATYTSGGNTYWGWYGEGGAIRLYRSPGSTVTGNWVAESGVSGLSLPPPNVRYRTYPVYPTDFYHADGNGNVTALLGTNGVVTGRYSYDPYGGVLTQSGAAAAANNLRFSSKEWCAQPGLYYYGFLLAALCKSAARSIERSGSDSMPSQNALEFATIVRNPYRVMTVTVSTKGQITLPVDWRKNHGLDYGGECDAVAVADGLLLKPRPQRRGMDGLLEFLMEQEVSVPSVERHFLPSK